MSSDVEMKDFDHLYKNGEDGDDDEMRARRTEQLIEYVHLYPNLNDLSLDEQMRKISIEIKSVEKNKRNWDCVFEVIGLNPVFLNTIRISIWNFVPTIAIEDVYFRRNTSSSFNNDYISSRLTLLPIDVDPSLFKFPSRTDPDARNSENCLVFHLNEQNLNDEPRKITSGDLRWRPIGGRQRSIPKTITVSHQNIPICTLKKNEEIDLIAHCVKGCGKIDAKFSPGFASYHFVSQIKLKNLDQISMETAHRIQNAFPHGVIDLIRNSDGRLMPKVVDAKLDHHTRSFLNFDDVRDSIEVRYYRDDVIFRIESFGVIDPIEMFNSAIKIVRFKAENLLSIISRKYDLFRKKSSSR
ncbi:solute carrier [Sarcoptes scabiei]|nr:solute carrier [Sarcoptes scabiei]